MTLLGTTLFVIYMTAILTGLVVWIGREPKGDSE